MEEQWHKQGIKPTLNKKGDCVSTFYTPGTGHLMAFLVASHMISPKGQSPDEVTLHFTFEITFISFYNTCKGKNKTKQNKTKQKQQQKTKRKKKVNSIFG